MASLLIDFYMKYSKTTSLKTKIKLYEFLKNLFSIQKTSEIKLVTQSDFAKCKLHFSQFHYFFLKTIEIFIN